MNDSKIFLHTEAGEMVSVFIDEHDCDDWFYVRREDGKGSLLHVRSCDLYHNCARLLSSYADFQD